MYYTSLLYIFSLSHTQALHAVAETAVADKADGTQMLLWLVFRKHVVHTLPALSDFSQLFRETISKGSAFSVALVCFGNSQIVHLETQNMK